MSQRTWRDLARLRAGDYGVVRSNRRRVPAGVLVRAGRRGLTRCRRPSRRSGPPGGLRVGPGGFQVRLPGGEPAEVVAHLTSGHVGGQQARGAAAESVRPCLPIEAAAAEVILMAGPRPCASDPPPGQWRTVAAFPLG